MTGAGGLKKSLDWNSVEVAAPSRLHFGLFSWGNPGRRFGGVGLMIERPGLRLVVERLVEADAADSSDAADSANPVNVADPSDVADTVHLEFGSERSNERSARSLPSGHLAVDVSCLGAAAMETNAEDAAEIRARIADFRRRWAAFHGCAAVPRLRWRVLEAPPRHAGLGSGTQWGLSVAAALDALSGRLPNELYSAPHEPHDPLDQATQTRERWVRGAAASVGRGVRSAVGAYGFVFGGLIIEPGKLAEETLSPLERRLVIPDDWRFVLVCPRVDHAARTDSVNSTLGLHGAAERQAFARLPPVPASVTDQLRAIAFERIGPAIERADCAAFGDAVYQFGVVAGGCFAAVQGGPFNGPVLADLAARLCSLGACGVGQSSWGPTLFAVMPTALDAAAFARDVASVSPVPVDVRITAPSNRGAAIRGQVLEAAVSSKCMPGLEHGRKSERGGAQCLS